MIPKRRGNRRRGRVDERGATIVIVGLLAVVLIAAAAFAVDLGMQRVVRSDAQAVADVVSLDLARDLDGTHSAAFFAAKWRAAGSTLQQSLDRNSSSVGRKPTSAPSGWLCNAKVCAQATPGYLSQDGAFTQFATPTAPSAIPTSVKVDVRGVTDVGLANAVGVRSGEANRSAVATSEKAPAICTPGDPSCSPCPPGVSAPCPGSPCLSGVSAPCPGAATYKTACLNVGSWLARLNLADATLINSSRFLKWLGAMAGVNLGALGYGGLADATVSVGSLVDVPRLNVGTVNELAGASVSAATLLDATVDALRANGQLADADLLGNVVNALKASGTGQLALSQPITVGSLLGVNSTSGASLEVPLNVFDLVTSTIFASSGDHFVGVPTLDVTPPALPGFPALGATTVSAGVIEPPQQVCGPPGAVGRTAQVGVRLETRLGSSIPPVNLSVPLLNTGVNLSASVGDQQGKVALDVQAARADVSITSVECQAGTSAAPDKVGISASPVIATLTRDGTNPAFIPVHLQGSVNVGASVLEGIPGIKSLFSLVEWLLGTTKPVDIELDAHIALGTQRSSPSLPNGMLLLPDNDTQAVSTHSTLGLTGVQTTLVVDRLRVAVAGVDLPAGNQLRESIASLLTGPTGAVTVKVGTPLLSTLQSYLEGLTPALGLDLTGADVTGVRRPRCETIKLTS